MGGTPRPRYFERPEESLGEQLPEAPAVLRLLPLWRWTAALHW